MGRTKKIANTVLFSILFSFTFLRAQAQRPNSFPFDQSQFIKAFEDFIRTSPKNELKDAAEDFYANYSTGKFNAAQKLSMIRLLNEMLNAGCQLSPDFERYIYTSNALIQSGKVALFENWHKTLSASIHKSRDDFQKFLNVSKNVFADKTLLDVGSFKWVCETNDIDLQVQGDPLFIFKNLNLYCFTPGDTFEIYHTSGRFIPSKNAWIGKGGKSDWTRVGLDSSDVFAQLKNYKLDLTDGTMIADSALLFYKSRYKQPLLGRVTDKPLGRSMGENSTYPQFESYENTFSGVKYGKAEFKGGFGLRGNLIQGKGVNGKKAELWFSYKGKNFLRMAANDFSIRDNKVSNDKVELTIFLDKDSIYHPQLRFQYLIKEDQIQLYRDNKMGISAAPFTDYYHMMEFNVDELKWNLNDPKVDLKMIAGDDPAKFNSMNFYREFNYEKIQGILDYNPLQRLKTYSEKNNSKTFSLESFAYSQRSDPSNMKIQMIELTDQGFIYYDSEKQLITIKQKLIDYVNSHNGRTDYDAISFRSIISALPNAHISLINNDLVIQGVPKFYFSDSQSVYIIPKDQQITIKKNRGIDFNGKLRAGMADFYGNNFSFDYLKFNVRLNNVDSLKFLYFNDSTGYLSNVKSVIQNIYGTLEIDHPYNKSGRRKFSKYPVFTSEVGSKVFYDYPTTQRGSYDRNRFYFDVKPFTLDSLADLNLYTLALPGTLISGGIIPDLPQEISMQADKSLGFFIADSSIQYPLYGGKGSARTTMSLSNEGLIGDGMVNYLASRSYSHRFVFLLDSMNANCFAFENDRTSLFPTIIKSSNVYNHWLPYQDTMFVENKGEPIRVSYDRARLSGTLILTPKAMKAKGKMDIEDGELIANMFELKPVEVLSEDARFRQRWPGDSTKIAFETGKVKAYVNLESKYADFFYNNPDVTNNTFAYNLYEGRFSSLRWDMIPRTLEFRGPSVNENPSQASYLISKRRSQDSLKFYSGSVLLTLGDYTMNCSKIPYINVADSKIVPDSGKAIIRKDAEMDMLLNAKIVADTTHAWHTVEQASVKINGRTDIRGAGNYMYTDKKKNVQRFYLSEIYIPDKMHLEGKTLIPDSINFMVGAKIGFRGNAILHSYNKNLEYNGFFKPIHEMFLPKTDWFKAAAVINPDSIYIQTEGQAMTNLNRQALVNGLYVSADSTHVYPALFSRRRNTSDAELMKCSGVYSYFEGIEEHRMGPYEKVYFGGRKGNFMALSEPKKIIYNEGKYNFGFSSSKFNVLAGGYSSFNLKDTTFAMKLAMIFDIGLPNAAIKLMADSINEQAASLNNKFVDEKACRIAVNELVSDKTFKKMSDDITRELSDNTIDELYKTLFISDISVIWNAASRSFISVGDIGLRSIDKYLVERKVKSMLEITKRRSGDDFTFYLTANNGSWYFFKYQKGIMYVVSSDGAFNEQIKANIDKVSNDDYKLRMGSFNDRNKFVRNAKLKKYNLNNE